MLKKISELAAGKLSAKEQQSIKGGRGCDPNSECCGLCSCGISNFAAYPGQYCGLCNGHAYYAGPGCI